MELRSDAFEDGDPVPREHTCDSTNLSPHLRWYDVPDGTESFALTCTDPDAPRGTWVHWVLYNLPASRTELAPGQPPVDTLPGGVAQGRNDFGEPGYGGPCPPPGRPHRYFFRLYALDGTLDLPPGATRAQLEEAMQGHVLARAELMGTYGR